MRIYREYDEYNFEPWGGAVDTMEIIKTTGKFEEFFDMLNEICPNGISEGELNDYLWFDSDDIFEMLEIANENED